VRFSTSVFFSSKVPTLDPDSYPNFSFEFAFKFMELLELKFDCIMQRGVKSLHSIKQRGVKSLRCMMQRGVKSMIVAEIFPLHDAVGS
jgi:hypothetical protein